jgi:hypothetical protein
MPCVVFFANWASSFRWARGKWCPRYWMLIEDADSDLPEALRPIFAEACREIREIEARIKQVERHLEATAEQLPAVEHLRTIPGIGLRADHHNRLTLRTTRDDRTSHPGTAERKERDGETGRTGAGTAENNCGLRGRCIDWLPGARIPTWPGVLGDRSNEAGDTFAVRPVSLTPVPTTSRESAQTAHLGERKRPSAFA